MTPSPQPGNYRPETEILTIAPILADPVEAAQFPQRILRFRNDRWARRVGLETLTPEKWNDHFGSFVPLPGSLPQPLALRYHGHQFRHYNPDIGDGRGFLFAQLRDDKDRLLDLGTKGSGQTPYSRFGDGRLTLKGGVREVLATEMLEALGVNTSKSFSLIETGEALHRGDEPSPTRSSVLVRLSHGHIRIGSFQRAYFHQDVEAMQALTRYCLRALYNIDDSAAFSADTPLILLQAVIDRAANLAASYMIAGFVHGVLNTDNIAITAESFDYGPWRFTPFWNQRFTAAYFDERGLYAFGRQAEAIYWNLAQLAGALCLVGEESALSSALDRFPDAYRTALGLKFCGRLGLAVTTAEARDQGLIAALQGLRQQTVEIDRFFHDWRSGVCPTERVTHYADPTWSDWTTWIAQHRAPQRDSHDYWRDENPCSMHIEEVESIWKPIAESDDWSAFESKIRLIRRMGEAHAIPT